MNHHGPRSTPPQHSSAWLCTTHLLLHTIVAGQSFTVRACLAYSAEEPYTVYLDSHTDSENPVTWVLSRELLTAGTTRPVGQGDVAVHPGEDGDAHHLYIALSGWESGQQTQVLLRAQSSDIDAFLRLTEHLVPPGTESDHLDLDTLARQLLDHDPPA